MKDYKTEKVNVFYYSLFSMALFFGTWQVIGHYEFIDPIFISTPFDIGKAGFDVLQSIKFYQNLLVSSESFILGFLLAISVGIGLGLIIGTNRSLYKFSAPYILALHATPIVALLPLIIIWFGYQSQIVIIFLMAVIPILMNTIDSARAVDDSLIQMSRSFKAKKMFVLRNIVFPSSLPYILSGIRVAGGRSVIGLIVGGFFAGGGIGSMMRMYGDTLQTDKLMFIIFILILFNLTIYKVTTISEKRLIKWKDY